MKLVMDPAELLLRRLMRLLRWRLWYWRRRLASASVFADNDAHAPAGTRLRARARTLRSHNILPVASFQ